MNKEKELINISYFDNQELSIKEHCDTYRKIVNEITNILRKYDIKFVLGETEVCKDLQHQLEEKDKVIDEAIEYVNKQIKDDYYCRKSFDLINSLLSILQGEEVK